MKRSISLSICLLITVCFMLTSVQVSKAAEPKRVLLGTTKTTSSFYAAAVEWAKLLNKYLGDELQVTVVESGGMVDNLRRKAKRCGQAHTS